VGRTFHVMTTQHPSRKRAPAARPNSCRKRPTLHVQLGAWPREFASSSILKPSVPKLPPYALVVVKVHLKRREIELFSATASDVEVEPILEPMKLVLSLLDEYPTTPPIEKALDAVERSYSSNHGKRHASFEREHL
jgi:hypothetical protein